MLFTRMNSSSNNGHGVLRRGRAREADPAPVGSPRLHEADDAAVEVQQPEPFPEDPIQDVSATSPDPIEDFSPAVDA